MNRTDKAVDQVLFSFENFCLDAGRQELRRAGEVIAIEPQILDLLFYLVRNRERVISKDDLMNDVWKGRIVSDSTLTSRIASARKAIGDSGKEQRLVRTISRKGIRFVGDVVEDTGGEDSLSCLNSTVPSGEPLRLTLPDKPSVAVLPFHLIGGQEEHAYFVDGLVDDIITYMSRSRDFFVIARNTSFSYRTRTPLDARQVGSELGIGYIIEGSARLRGRTLRIVADLVETSGGRQLWSEPMQRRFTNSFALQDDIAKAVAATMQTQILLSEGVLSAARREDELRRNDILNRAWQNVYRLSERGLKAGKALAEEALRDDGESARGHLILAVAYHHLAYLGFVGDQRDGFERALEHGLRALRLEPDSEYNNWIVGSSMSQVRRFDEALTHLRRATEINDNFSLAHGSWGTVLAWLGHYEEAIAKTQLALRLNPRDPANFLRHFVMALATFGLREYRESAYWSDLVIAERPRWYLASLVGAASLALAGDVQHARLVLRKLVDEKPGIDTGIVTELPLGNPEIGTRLRKGLRLAGLCTDRSTKLPTSYRQR
jgi:TolB-like protein